MIRCSHDLFINPAGVMSFEFERHNYANCPGPAFLIVTMLDGKRHRIEHAPHHLNGADCYKIADAIESFHFQKADSEAKRMRNALEKIRDEVLAWAKEGLGE